MGVLTRDVDYLQVPPHEPLLPPYLPWGLQILQVRSVDVWYDWLVVCPNGQVLAPQGEVGDLILGIDQACELPVCRTVVGLGRFAEPAPQAEDFASGFATVKVGLSCFWCLAFKVILTEDMTDSFLAPIGEESCVRLGSNNITPSSTLSAITVLAFSNTL